MWKAVKIELTRNKDDIYYRDVSYLDDCSTLKINDVLIFNAIRENTRTLSVNGWQRLVCTECGQEYCNPVGTLMMRKRGDTLLIVPDFEQMEGFEEYDYDEDRGNRYCAPHEWYEDGILVIEGEMLKLFLELMPGIANEVIMEPTREEQVLISAWENAVKLKPQGFMNTKNRQY